MQIARFRRPLSVVGFATMALTLGGCAGDPTQQEFIDHGVEISSAATTDAEKSVVEKTFDCMWGTLKSDSELLSDFMSSDEITPELSERISPAMSECIVQAAPPTSVATTTTAAPTTTAP